MEEVGSAKMEVGSKGREQLIMRELQKLLDRLIRHLQWFKGQRTFWPSNTGGWVGRWKWEEKGQIVDFLGARKWLEKLQIRLK